MRIDLQIPANLPQQVGADFFLPILQGSEFFAEVQATMAALASIGNKLARDLLPPSQFLYSPLKFGTLHTSSLGRKCPNVKRTMSAAKFRRSAR
jgi:hypothetical protein